MKQQIEDIIKKNLINTSLIADEVLKVVVENIIIELGKINFLEDITGDENRKLTIERYRKFKNILKELSNLSPNKENE